MGGGHIVTEFTKRVQIDRLLFGIKKINDENSENALKLVDEILKNTNRTLMTLGMKGCYIYFGDMMLQTYFKEKFDIGGV